MMCRVCGQPTKTDVGLKLPWMTSAIPLCESCQHNAKELVKTSLEGLTEIGVRPSSIKSGYQLAKGTSGIVRGMQDLIRAIR